MVWASILFCERYLAEFNGYWRSADDESHIFVLIFLVKFSTQSLIFTLCLHNYNKGLTTDHNVIIMRHTHDEKIQK